MEVLTASPVIFGILLGSASRVGRNRTTDINPPPTSTRASNRTQTSTTATLKRTFQCPLYRAGFSNRTKSAWRAFATPEGGARAWRSTTQVCGVDRGGWPREVTQGVSAWRTTARAHDLAPKNLRYLRRHEELSQPQDIPQC